MFPLNFFFLLTPLNLRISPILLNIPFLHPRGLLEWLFPLVTNLGRTFVTALSEPINWHLSISTILGPLAFHGFLTIPNIKIFEVVPVRLITSDF